MRIGICRGMARYAGDVDAQYAHLKALGFDTTDESLCETEMPYYANREAMEEHCKPIREAAEKYGIEVFQVHASYGVWYEKETWDETYEGILDILRLGLYGAHLMGAKNYVLHPLCESGFWYERTFFTGDEVKERTIQCVAVEGLPFGSYNDVRDIAGSNHQVDLRIDIGTGSGMNPVDLCTGEAFHLLENVGLIQILNAELGEVLDYITEHGEFLRILGLSGRRHHEHRHDHRQRQYQGKQLLGHRVSSFLFY